MPDDEWAEVLQGVPAKNEPFINKYLAGREALIVQEKKQRSGKQEILMKVSPIDDKSQTIHSANLSRLLPGKLARSSTVFETRSVAQYGPPSSKISWPRRLEQMFILA
jgi:hypothetical protein